MVLAGAHYGCRSVEAVEICRRSHVEKVGDWEQISSSPAGHDSGREIVASLFPERGNYKLEDAPLH